MIGKVKDWLGIEGVKVDILVPEIIDKSSGVINGTLRFHTLRAQDVESISLKLIERYSRGRRKDKLVDEYILGEGIIDQSFSISESELKDVDFSLPFEAVGSAIDKMESNFLLTIPAKMAKYVRGAKSVYRLEVKLKVKGVRLPPLVNKILTLK